jgi:hypothetical protein
MQRLHIAKEQALFSSELRSDAGMVPTCLAPGKADYFSHVVASRYPPSMHAFRMYAQSQRLVSTHSTASRLAPAPARLPLARTLCRWADYN